MICGRSPRVAGVKPSFLVQSRVDLVNSQAFRGNDAGVAVAGLALKSPVVFGDHFDQYGQRHALGSLAVHDAAAKKNFVLRTLVHTLCPPAVRGLRHNVAGPSLRHTKGGPKCATAQTTARMNK